MPSQPWTYIWIINKKIKKSLNHSSGKPDLLLTICVMLHYEKSWQNLSSMYSGRGRKGGTSCCSVPSTQSYIFWPTPDLKKELSRAMDFHQQNHFSLDCCYFLHWICITPLPGILCWHEHLSIDVHVDEIHVDNTAIHHPNIYALKSSLQKSLFSCNQSQQDAYGL